MSLGRRRREQQDTFWVPADRLGSGPRNAFYDRLNEILAEIEFDKKLEDAAEPYYQSTGRKSIPPGVYFRMIFIGYFEDISSQRGIAWRCEDSRSLARFLGYQPGELTPEHSTLSVTRERLPMSVHELAFQLILSAAKDHGLLKGKTIAVDATDLEANASLKSIVRKDTGEDWREYVRKLYEQETGKSDPDDEELRRFDRRRRGKNKKVSNQEWKSATDPDARLGQMKDGRYHFKYKAENAIDIETEVIVAAEVYHGNLGDTQTIEDTVNSAKTHLREADTGCDVKEAVADKGYHAEQTLDALQNESDVRTYIPVPDQKRRRKWTNKSKRREASFRRNKRNASGRRGRRLQRLRSERVERTFAHLCDTGGSRRTWLRGIRKVQKRFMSAAMAFNLGRIMRALTGAGKPKHASVLAVLSCFSHLVAVTMRNAIRSLRSAFRSHDTIIRANFFSATASRVGARRAPNLQISTGC